MKSEAVYKYLALKPYGEAYLEIGIHRCLSLVLAAKKMGIPFIYAPFLDKAYIGKSIFSLDVLNRKWEEFFRQIAHEFLHIDQLDGEMFPVSDFLNRGQTPMLIFFDQTSQAQYKINSGVKMMRAVSYGASPEACEGITESEMSEFIERSHCAYAKVFSSGARAPFEGDVLQAVFIIPEDGGLRTPVFFKMLGPMLDFIEECARSIGCDVEVHLFTSFKDDKAMPTRLQVHKEQALSAACSRSYVHHHQRPFFEDLVNAAVFADFTWVSGTFYGRDILREMLFLLSNPRQVLIEMVPAFYHSRLNHCFFSWDGEKLLYEREKVLKLLEEARYGAGGLRKLCASFKRRVGTALIGKRGNKKRSEFNIALGMIDGVGSYFSKKLVMQTIADYYGLRYVHIPPLLDHNYLGDLEWERKWEEFFAYDKEPLELDKAFDDGLPNVCYYYRLPPLQYLHNADIPASSLIVSSQAEFGHYPVPDDYLFWKLSEVRRKFQEKRQHDRDCFNEGVLNVAIHLREPDNYSTPLTKVYREFRGFGSKRIADYCTHLISILYKTLQQLSMPFNVHVYSNISLEHIDFFRQFENIELHSKQKDQRLCCLEMSRADILVLGESLFSSTAALFARPDQIQLIINRHDPDILRFLLCNRNAIYRGNSAILEDVRLIERLLDKRACGVPA